MLLITCGDEYLGYCLTSHLAQIRHLRKDMRVLCQDNKLSPCLTNFRSKGIQVTPVDYSHPNNLSKAMRNVDQMILCMSHHPDRVQHAQQLCKVALQSGVQSILYLSHVGALTTNKYTALNDYGLVEKYLIQTCRDIPWAIMRLDWIQQYFDFWSCQVESKKQLRMPLKQDVGICPVHISDLCEIVARVVVGSDGNFIDKLKEDHHGQVYTITGPEKVMPDQIIQKMANATQFHSYKYQIERPMDTLYYLKDLCHHIWFDERQKTDERLIYNDTLDGNMYNTKILSNLQDKQIQTFLNYFEWVNEFSGSVSVEHTQKLLIDREPSGLQVFFNENANKFKPKV